MPYQISSKPSLISFLVHQDILVGFDFAPLVYENEKTGRLGVDMRVVNDVREQHKGRGENLHESSCAPPSSESNNSQFDSRNGMNFSRGTSSIFSLKSDVTTK